MKLGTEFPQLLILFLLVILFDKYNKNKEIEAKAFHSHTCNFPKKILYLLLKMIKFSCLGININNRFVLDFSCSVSIAKGI